MPTSLKVLTRQTPEDNFGIDAYTVPEDTKTLITNVVVSNSDVLSHNFSISIYSDEYELEVPIATSSPVPPRDSIILDIKQLMEENDILRIAAVSGSANVSFHVTGLEITP
jgi:hypothetical protein